MTDIQGETEILSFLHIIMDRFFSDRSTVIADTAAISVLWHASQGKHKYRAVFCHWLDGYIPDVSGAQ